MRLTPSMRHAAKEEAKELSNAVEILYPARPDPGLPSPLNASELIGSYYDEGYGVLQIESEQGEMMARRDDMLFMYTLRFKHVSGAFWVIELWYEDTKSMAGFWGGEFAPGVDGGVAGLKVRLGPQGGGGPKWSSVWFERLS